jgi:hypothetical protein
VSSLETNESIVTHKVQLRSDKSADNFDSIRCSHVVDGLRALAPVNENAVINGKLALKIQESDDHTHTLKSPAFKSSSEVPTEMSDVSSSHQPWINTRSGRLATNGLARRLSKFLNIILNGFPRFVLVLNRKRRSR